MIYMDNVVVYSLVFMDVTKFLVFFLTCYYFSSQAIDFLPYASKWLLGLKIYLSIGLFIQLSTALWYIIGSYNDFQSAASICKQPLLLVLRFTNEFMIFIFFILGILITREVR